MWRAGYFACGRLLAFCRSVIVSLFSGGGIRSSTWKFTDSVPLVFFVSVVGIWGLVEEDKYPVPTPKIFQGTFLPHQDSTLRVVACRKCTKIDKIFETTSLRHSAQSLLLTTRTKSSNTRPTTPCPADNEGGGGIWHIHDYITTHKHLNINTNELALKDEAGSISPKSHHTSLIACNNNPSPLLSP